MKATPVLKDLGVYLNITMAWKFRSLISKAEAQFSTGAPGTMSGCSSKSTGPGSCAEPANPELPQMYGHHSPRYARKNLHGWPAKIQIRLNQSLRPTFSCVPDPLPPLALLESLQADSRHQRAAPASVRLAKAQIRTSHTLTGDVVSTRRKLVASTSSCASS